MYYAKCIIIYLVQIHVNRIEKGDCANLYELDKNTLDPAKLKLI